MSKSFFLFIISLLLLTGISGQVKQDKKITEILDQLIPERLPEIAPDCVVLIVKKDIIIYRKAFGAANTELNLPMQSDMLFRTGSMCKQYTAIAVLQLVEQGKIILQDSIQNTSPISHQRGYNYY